MESPFDEEGWLITGDVVICKNKKIYIVGRSKDLVKLDNGEYISPENIENKLSVSDFIKDIFISKIIGEDKFVALVSVPDESIGIEQIASYLKKAIASLVSQKIIPRCVEISRFSVLRELFLDFEGGVLFTPTLKKKRFVFSQKFETLLNNSNSIEDVIPGVVFENGIDKNKVL